MTDSRDGFRPYWPSTVTPFDTASEPPSVPARTPWQHPLLPNCSPPYWIRQRFRSRPRSHHCSRAWRRAFLRLEKPPLGWSRPCRLTNLVEFSGNSRDQPRQRPSVGIRVVLPHGTGPPLQVSNFL
jgi:hypothetical protein